ncbi:hypothetical protein ACP70R_050192 [Stipagrostis hirtigluma subsp. patula]
MSQEEKEVITKGVPYIEEIVKPLEYASNSTSVRPFSEA